MGGISCPSVRLAPRPSFRVAGLGPCEADVLEPEFQVNGLIEGSLEVKLPTIWTDEKQSRAEAERRGRLEERRSEEKESEERRCRCAKR